MAISYRTYSRANQGYYNALALGHAIQIVVQWPVYDLRPLFAPATPLSPYLPAQPNLIDPGEREFAHGMGAVEYKWRDYRALHPSKYDFICETAGGIRFCNGEKQKTPFSSVQIGNLQIQGFKIIERNYIPVNESLYIVEFVIHCPMGEKSPKQISRDDIRALLAHLASIQVKGSPMARLTTGASLPLGERAGCLQPDATVPFFSTGVLFAARYRYASGNDPLATPEYIGSGNHILTIRTVGFNSFSFDFELPFGNDFFRIAEFLEKNSTILINSSNIKQLKKYIHLFYNLFCYVAMVYHRNKIEHLLLILNDDIDVQYIRKKVMSLTGKIRKKYDKILNTNLGNMDTIYGILVGDEFEKLRQDVEAMNAPLMRLGLCRNAINKLLNVHRHNERIPAINNHAV